ncbi:zinc knuckle [Cooperia oncophora]
MPITRSLAKSSSSLLGSSTQLTDTKPSKKDPDLSSSLPSFEDLQDDSPSSGRDVKALRDATCSVISQVWNDTRATAALLSRKINDGNTALTERLNESFAASCPGPVRVAAGVLLLRALLGHPLRSRTPTPFFSSSQYQRTPSAPNRSVVYRCFNCDGVGHFSSVCPSPRTPSAGRSQGFSPPQPPRRVMPPHRLPGANSLTWDLSPSSEHHTMRPAAEPASTVAQLTASLKDSERQLRNSQARIQALLQRNDELAQASLEHPFAPPRTSSSSLPDTRLLLCAVISLPCSAIGAWLCPPDQPATFFLPQRLQNCSGFLPNSTVSVTNLSLHLYRPNTKLYSTPVFLCKIIKHSVVYSVNFFGARKETHTETSLAFQKEECKQMMLHHRCVPRRFG